MNVEGAIGEDVMVYHLPDFEREIHKSKPGFFSLHTGLVRFSGNGTRELDETNALWSPSSSSALSFSPSVRLGADDGSSEVDSVGGISALDMAILLIDACSSILNLGMPVSAARPELSDEGRHPAKTIAVSQVEHYSS